jgi:hypothetical protein
LTADRDTPHLPRVEELGDLKRFEIKADACANNVVLSDRKTVATIGVAQGTRCIGDEAFFRIRVGEVDDAVVVAFLDEKPVWFDECAFIKSASLGIPLQSVVEPDDSAELFPRFKCTLQCCGMNASIPRGVTLP